MRVGWEFCHSIIDDHTRLAYTEIHADERAADRHRVRRSARCVLRRPRHHRRGALQTDNAFTYVHNRCLRELLAERGIQHRRIPPRTPKRNGKVERYQQTLAREWAYGQRYRDSDARAAALPHLAHPLQHHQEPQLARQPAADQPRSEAAEAQQLARRLLRYLM